MIRKFDSYRDIIRHLPEKSTYAKTDLLIPELFIEGEGRLEIYYAAHNEYVNEAGRVLIVGIAPGWRQMERSLQIARRGLLEGWPDEVILRTAKLECRFMGSMRVNLVAMLDELNLARYFGLRMAGELFQADCSVLHTTSLIPFPVLVQGENYTGHQPAVRSSVLLKRYVLTSFLPELAGLRRPLVIPLGRAVEEVLGELVREGILQESQCLWGFPHPSGANGHRQRQWAQSRDQLRLRVDRFFR